MLEPCIATNDALESLTDYLLTLGISWMQKEKQIAALRDHRKAHQICNAVSCLLSEIPYPDLIVIVGFCGDSR